MNATFFSMRIGPQVLVDLFKVGLNRNPTYLSMNLCFAEQIL